MDPGAGLAERIDALLPQTQCTRCGFSGCRPYAEAIARGEARIDRCPPGGEPVGRALAAMADAPYAPVDPGCGPVTPPQVAVIDEAECIGCAKCIEACPTDAIVGARRWMHTVVAAECSGCELCLPPCPVDCISMQPDPAGPARLLTGLEIGARAARYRRRFESRRARLTRDESERRYALAAVAAGPA